MFNKVHTKPLVLAAFLLCAAAGMTSCMDKAELSSTERVRGESHSTLTLGLTIAEPEGTKSSLIGFENKVYDLNVWQYTNLGKLLATYYIDGMTATGSFSHTFEGDFLEDDQFVFIANAGYALYAPSFISGEAYFSNRYVPERSGQGVLAAQNISGISKESEKEFICYLTLYPVLSKINFRAKIDDSTPYSMYYTYPYGRWNSTVRIKSLRMMNTPDVITFYPNNVVNSFREFICYDGDVARVDGFDYLSESEILEMNGNATGLLTPTYTLYTLPNLNPTSQYKYTDNFDFAKTTKMEAIFELDELGYSSGSGTVSPGEIKCLFCPIDGEADMCHGGYEYNTTLVLSNGCSLEDSYFERKIDTRFYTPTSTYIIQDGERVVNLYQWQSFKDDSRILNAEPGDYFSLSENSTVLNDGIFSITGMDVGEDIDCVTDEVSGAEITVSVLYGAYVTPLSPGTSTLWFKRDGVKGHVTLVAAYRTGLDTGNNDDGGNGNNDYD